MSRRSAGVLEPEPYPQPSGPGGANSFYGKSDPANVAADWKETLDYEGARVAEPMNETVAVLVAVAIGAVAGLAGGGFAALASIRASQVAARASLAPKLHELSNAIVSLQGAIRSGAQEEAEAKKNLECVWNDFAVHQRILCPSQALERLAYARAAECQADHDPDPGEEGCGAGHQIQWDIGDDHAHVRSPLVMGFGLVTDRRS